MFTSCPLSRFAGSSLLLPSFFFFNDTATTEIYTLPYTTLFRSREPGAGDVQLSGLEGHVGLVLGNVLPRSEEHTSELQSRLHLVCRLLLEKKKRAATDHDHTVLIHGSQYFTSQLTIHDEGSART